MLLNFEDIKNNQEIRTYIKNADATLKSLGYTEHSYAHAETVARTTGMILKNLGYDDREVEIAKIAGYLHDIGNSINRYNHAFSGANMAFTILSKLEFPAEEISKIITAIGHHDEGSAAPINPLTAAIIISDKTDVRRSRVRNTDFITFDIHDRVNYAALDSKVYFNEEKTELTFDVTIDTEIAAVMEYFEIFLERMLLCKKSAIVLNLTFKFVVNGLQVL